MFRYLSIVWNNDSPAQRDIAKSLARRLRVANSTWTPIVDSSGLTVLCTGGASEPAELVLLPSRNGVVLGTLFERSNSGATPARVTTLSPHATAMIEETAGRSLVTSHWGSYVLFLSSKSGRNVHIFRGPMSSLSCFWAVHQGVTIFFSSVEDCIALQCIPFSINWECVRAQSVGGDYLTNETAIREVSTLVAGECMELDSNHTTSCLYWNPASIRAEESVETLDEAASLLGDCTQLCVNAWASAHKDLVLQLSGGLDSSILLACLSRAPTRPRISSANFWSRGSDDERAFARGMAAKTETALTEFERTTDVDLRRFLSCAPTGNPVVHYSAFDSEPRLVTFARERRATAIFTGEIGDDIFGHAPAPEVLAECLCSYGLSLKFAQAAADYGELTRVSLWKAISLARRYREWQRRTQFWSLYRYKRDILGISGERSLAAKEVELSYEQMLSRFIHPWFRDIGGMPLGRTMLIYSLISVTSTWTHSAFGGVDAPVTITPFASQPLVEAFCAIPSHLHFARAENGAVARRAFRLMLSEDVLKRGIGKGTIDLWLQDLIPRNRSFLQDLMLDGVLMREGILDKEKVTAMLSGTVSSSLVGTEDLVVQLYIESWLRRWMSVAAKAAA